MASQRRSIPRPENPNPLLKQGANKLRDYQGMLKCLGAARLLFHTKGSVAEAVKLTAAPAGGNSLYANQASFRKAAKQAEGNARKLLGVLDHLTTQEVGFLRSVTS
jgi:hypothetical protein